MEIEHKQCPLRINGEPLYICRGCDLSCEVHIGYEKDFCEICTTKEYMTVKVLEKLIEHLTSSARVEKKLIHTTIPTQFMIGGEAVRKIRGSQWHGYVVGYYSTKITSIGYAVESYYEPGSVQVYPENALEVWRK